MKAIKTILIIFLVLLVLFGALLAGGVIYLNRYVQTPEFKQQVLAMAKDTVGSDVKINEINVSLFSGITLDGVAIANPQGFAGNLLTADSFVLSYRLLPLLKRRVEIEQLSLEKPVITIARNDRREWNYEKVGATTPTPAAPAYGSTTPTKTTAPPLDIMLSKLAVSHGEILMLSEKNKPLVKLDSIELASSIDLVGNMLSGTGKAGIGQLTVADSLFVRRLASPVALSATEVKLSPLSGRVADGSVAGDLTLQLADGFRYVVDLQVKDSSVSKLLQEAGAKQVMTGSLQVSAKLEGSGGLPTIVGNGRAEIVDGRFMEIPLLNLLATLLQVAELRELKFDECLLEFTITNNVMQTPVVRLNSPKVQINGKGAVSLDDYSLKHDMTLALAPGMLDRVPKEIRNVFTVRQDGFHTLDFRVWGPYDSPKTDLKERIVKGATEQLIEKGIQKLFK